MTVGAVIPAYNEAGRIGPVLEAVRTAVDEVVVVDDASSDATAEVARDSGAIVYRLRQNVGYKEALLHGLRNARSDVLVTLDADGEHAPSRIVSLVAPILEGKADLVVATRPRLPRWSERALSSVTSAAVPTEDASTGLRALRRDLVSRMRFPGPCLCGSFLLEAASVGARIEQVSLAPVVIEKPRRRSWVHGRQLFTVVSLIPGARRAIREGRTTVRDREGGG